MGSLSFHSMLSRTIRRMSSRNKNNTVDNFSIHGNAIQEVHEIPMSAINRPTPSVLDQEKVERMKQVLQDEEHKDDLTPIVSLNTPCTHNEN